MSIRKMIEQKIQDVRLQIAIWDNPTASSEAKGKVLATLVGDDPHFWAEVAKRATIKPASTKTPTKAQIEKAVAGMKTVAEPPASKPTTVVLESASAPKPVKPTTPAPATVAPRTLKILSVGGSDFGNKINGVAANMKLIGENSPLGKFRALMLDNESDSREYWMVCRKAVMVVLSEKLIKEHSDWQLLVTKMKVNPFFVTKNTKMAEKFLGQVPKDLVINLLLDENGLWNYVEDVRSSHEHYDGHVDLTSFVIDACLLALTADGQNKDVKTLLTNCKHAVNRMKQMAFIGAGHWLVAKVAAMKVVKPARAEKPETASEEPAQQQVEAVVDHKLDNIQQVAEVVASATVN